MAKKAASESALGELHAAVAVGLTTVIKDGVPVADKEGDVTVAPAAPAYYAAAIAFLKNNSITASADENVALNNLAAALAAKRKDAKTGLTQAGLDKAAEEFANIHANLQ